jgi:hypothetical protein
VTVSDPSAPHSLGIEYPRSPTTSTTGSAPMSPSLMGPHDPGPSASQRNSSSQAQVRGYYICYMSGC